MGISEICPRSGSCDEFECILVVDDAHGIGAIGPNAGGVEDYFDCFGAADYICGTLSKSCSAQGGYVVSNNKTSIEMLIMSPGVGFATGMNAFSAAYATKALEFIMANGAMQVKEATMLRAYMADGIRSRLPQFKVEESPSRLCTILVDHPTRAMHIQSELIKLGYLVSQMCFPAVQMHQSLLRMTIIPSVYTPKVIDGFLDALVIAVKRTENVADETNSRLLHSNALAAEKAEEKLNSAVN